MKIISLVIGFMLMASFAFAEIATTQGEQKIAIYLRQMHTLSSDTKNQLDSIYLKAKNYVTDHPTQFTTDNKTKLNALQTKINTVTAALLDLYTQISTDFPGVNE